MFGFGKKAPAPAKEQTIAEEAGLPGNWVPVEAPVVRPGIETNGPHQYPSGTLPQLLGLQPDLVDTKYGGGIPSVRLMPIASTAATNAAVAATVKTIIQTTPAPAGAGGGIASVAMTVPSILTISGSPVTPPGGTLALGLAPEPASTVLAAPGIGLSGLEAVVAGAVGPTVAGPGSVLSLIAAPTTATSWGLFTHYTNAGTSPTPPGWTQLTSDPVFTKSLTGVSPVTVSETVPATNNGGLSTLAIFSGAMPAIIQSKSAGFTFPGPQSTAFTSSNTLGNTIIIVMTCVGDINGIAPSLGASDSNGNTYTALSNLAYGGTITNVHGNNQGLSQQVLIAVNCAAGANTVTWTVGGQTGGGRIANIYMYEIGPLAAGPGIPFFRQLNGGDFSGFDATKIISGLVPINHGGTGADLSATGGTGKVLKQVTAGGFITVGAIDFTELTGNVATTANVQNGFASASLGPTNLYTANGSFLYQISYNLVTVSAGTAGTVSLTLTWNNGAAQTFTTPTAALATLGNYVSGSIIVKSGGTPQWATTVTGPLGSPFYAVDIRVVPLG